MRLGVPGRSSQKDRPWPCDVRLLKVHWMPLLPRRLPVQCAAVSVGEARALCHEVRHVLCTTGKRAASSLCGSVSGASVDRRLVR